MHSATWVTARWKTAEGEGRTSSGCETARAARRRWTCPSAPSQRYSRPRRHSPTASSSGRDT
eukprot:3467978-Rhodomonas_salina.4